MYWKTEDYKRKMGIGESPVGALYKNVILVTNMRNSVYSNSIAQLFDCLSPP